MGKYLMFLLGAGLLPAQTKDYRKQEITAAFRYELGLGRTAFDLVSGAPGWGIGYTYRPKRWLALEAALDQLPRPVGNSICCRYFPDARDELFLVPFGARGTWDVPGRRVALSLGGGGAYMSHTFAEENPAIGLRGVSAWGAQFSASGRYAITGSRRFWVGITARSYYLKSDRDTTLRLLTLGPDFTFAF